MFINKNQNYFSFTNIDYNKIKPAMSNYQLMNYKDIIVNYMFKHLNFNIINNHYLNYKDIIMNLKFIRFNFKIIDYH